MDTTAMDLVKTYFDEYLKSVPQTDNKFIILTLIGLFVGGIVLWELKDRRNYARKKEEQERADRIREKENDAKAQFANEIKGLIAGLSSRLDQAINGLRTDIHLLDKRLTIVESRHPLKKDQGNE